MNGELLGVLAVPVTLVAVGVLLLFSGQELYEPLKRGIEQGGRVTLSVFPALLLLSVGVSMLSASGFPGLLSEWLAPVGEALGIPLPVLPLSLIRPFSGSGSVALLSDLFADYGPDSAAGLCASVLMGSSDTLVYVICLYFSSVGVRRTRYAFPVAIFVMVVCLLLSAAFSRRFFA